jgi:sucrose phosphorylase
MPGKPQIWYLDLFAGKNDYEAVKRAGEDGHKEINRTNLTREEVEHALEKDVVKKQLEMIKFRLQFPAFSFDSTIKVAVDGSNMQFRWEKDGYVATLWADLQAMIYKIDSAVDESEIMK